MAEPKSGVLSQSSEYSESSQHDMMSLVNMATGKEPPKAPTVNEIVDQLRTQQWEQYPNEQLVRNRASNKIAFLAALYYRCRQAYKHATNRVSST